MTSTAQQSPDLGGYLMLDETDDGLPPGTIKVVASLHSQSAQTTRYIDSAPMQPTMLQEAVNVAMANKGKLFVVAAAVVGGLAVFQRYQNR